MMNKFTDEDLARFKELANPNSPDELERLGAVIIARMECAERFMAHQEAGRLPCNDCVDLFNAWLQSCGREAR